MNSAESKMPPVAILSGGLATRLRPLTEKVSKAMLPVADEPFVAHQLRLLQRQGVRRAVFCIGYLGEQIRDFVGNGAEFSLDVEYSTDGDCPLGTGGALKRALPLLGGEFLVIYGDSYLLAPIAPVVDAFRRSTALGLMTVYRNQDKWDSSNVEYRDARIIRYSKTKKNPRMQHIDYGLSAFRPEAFEDFSKATPFDLSDLFQSLLNRQALLAIEVSERFYEIGSAAGLQELNDRILEERHS